MIALGMLLEAGRACAGVPVPLAEAAGYQQGEPVTPGIVTNVIDRSGLSAVGTDVSAWTHGNSWTQGWQGRGDMTPLAGNVGWMVVKLAVPARNLQQMFLWNVNENASYRLAAGLKTFEIYYADAPVVPPPALSFDVQDYDFASGGWTKLGGTHTIAKATGSTVEPCNGIYELGGISAQYIGLKFLENYNADAVANLRPGTGLSEIVLTVPTYQDLLPPHVVPPPVITTYVMGDSEEGDGSISGVVNGSGLTRTDFSDPATWTHDNFWEHGWQGRGDLTLLSDSVGWVVMDMETVVNGLRSLCLWNVNENAEYRLATGVQTFEIYYAEAPVQLPPPTGAVIQDYSFATGGWTRAGDIRTAAKGTGSNSGAVDGQYDLGGIRARYIGLRFLTNYNADSVSPALIPGTGLAELVLTRDVAVAPASDFRITAIAFNRTTSIASLTWLSEAAATYTVQRAADLAGPWLSVHQEVPSGGVSTQYSDAVPAGSLRYFYRVLKNP